MILPIVARNLEAQAARFRDLAAGIMQTGRPVEVMLNGQPHQLHQLTSLDLIDEASALEADAAKLRTIYQ